MFQNQGVNKIILVGHIHGKPEWHTIDKHRCLCFQLITVEEISRQGGVYEHYEHHFMRIPESIVENTGNYIEDGAQLYVEGKITTKPSVDNNGIKRYNTTIIAFKYTVMAKAGVQVLNNI